MIYGFSAQNLCKGGTRFVLTFDTLVSVWAVGETATGGTSGGTATITYVDNSAGVMRLIATSGKLEASETITNGTGASANVATIEDYDAPRSAVSGDAPASGCYIEAGANYQTSDLVKFELTGTTAKSIVFDRGATQLTDEPLFFMLSRLVVSDYNYRGTQDSTATNLASIIWEQADDSGFSTNLETLATITNSTTADGAAPFGLFNVFAENNSGNAATRRYHRIKFTPTADVDISFGGVWIGAGFDTVADGVWSFQDGFNIANINRNISTEQDGGAKSERPRQAIRRWSITPQFVRGQWQDFYDAARGDLPNVIDSSANPWAFCLDPDNTLRATTGAHWFSGMFKFDGTVTLTDTGANKDGEFFLPRLSVRLREHV